MTPFRVRRRVEFGETDMAGIMHFSNYFRHMEAAECAFLRSLGLSVCWQVDGEKISFPRVAVSCNYLRPAKFEDEIDVQITIESIGSKSIRYRHDFFRGEELLAQGQVTAVCCKATPGQPLQSVEIPPEIRRLLETAGNPASQTG